MALVKSLRPLLPPLLILLAGGGLLAGLVLTRPEPPVPERVQGEWVVATRPVEPHAASSQLLLYGQVESPRAATLTAAVAAEVEAVPVREGQGVSRGESLVSLERADLAAILKERKADLSEARARIEEARAQHEGDLATVEHREELVELARRGVERSRRLAKRDLGSSEQVDTARQVLEQARLQLAEARTRVRSFPSRLNALQARRERAEARVEQARRDLARTRIKAPFGGRITEVDVAPGDRVQVGDPLVGVYDTGALEVRATIPAPQVPRIRRAVAAGEAVPAEVTVDHRTYEARLDRFGGRSPEGASGIEGIFRLTGDRPRDLPLGRFAELRVTLPPERGVVAVPYSALYDRDRIFVVREGLLVRLPVERVGQRLRTGEADRALIRAEGLRPGDRVVTTQLPIAREGLAVKVADDTAGGS